MGADRIAHDRGRRAVGAELGPGSLLWETAGDPRGLLTGSTAGILQLMLPGLGAGVTDHSDFFEDPFDRIFRSIPPIWGSIFAPDDDEGARAGRMIRDFHPDIKGTDHNGERYHALDPEVFWWAHATFTWEFFRARELFFPVPLRRSQKVQLYAESVTWYRRYGVSDRCVPQTLGDFEQRFEEICREGLEITPAADWVLNPESSPGARGGQLRLPGPLSLLNGVVNHLGAEVLRTIVYGSMPDVVRRRFDFGWTHADRIRFASVCATLRALDPAIRRGALSELYPEGTPRLAPGSRSEVIIAGPSPRQHRRTKRSSTAA
jgi:uncharacterized protein (DUF2236 family)